MTNLLRHLKLPMSAATAAPLLEKAAAFSDFARKTTVSASDFASAVRNLIKDLRDSYRPELHYMRGRGQGYGIMLMIRVCLFAVI